LVFGIGYPSVYGDEYIPFNNGSDSLAAVEISHMGKFGIFIFPFYNLNTELL
jgi:hypothetical protein